MITLGLFLLNYLMTRIGPTPGTTIKLPITSYLKSIYPVLPRVPRLARFLWGDSYVDAEVDVWGTLSPSAYEELLLWRTRAGAPVLAVCTPVETKPSLEPIDLDDVLRHLGEDTYTYTSADHGRDW